MSQGINQTFACPHCGKRFTWNARFAGKKLSCACGGVFEPTLGLEAIGVDRQAYDVGMNPVLSDAPAASAPKRNIAAVYPRRKKTTAKPNAPESNVAPVKPVRDFIFPSILLFAGIVIRIIPVLHVASASMPAAIVIAGLDIFLTAAVMLGGAYIAAMVIGVEFGRLHITALKLVAIGLFSGGLASLAVSLDHSSTPVHGLVLGMYITVFLYFVLFITLFELDLLEALSTVVIVWVLQSIVAVAVFSILSK
jgi:hypothetical protein